MGVVHWVQHEGAAPRRRAPEQAHSKRNLLARGTGLAWRRVCRPGPGRAPRLLPRRVHLRPPSPGSLADPNPFFEALLKRPYRGAVVLSPSVYSSDAPPPPPEPAASPGMAAARAAGAGVQRAWPDGPGPVKVMDTTFAYLTKEGYCSGDDCQKFPVAVGQFASAVDTKAGLGALNDFAAHLSASDVPFDGVGTWRFWGFDGGDGGGGEAGVPGAS